MLHVIDGLGTGGAERSLFELLAPLAARGHRPLVARLYERGEGIEAAVRAAGWDVRELHGPHLPARARRLRSLCREVRPDLVHSTLYESNLVARLALLGTKIPLLTSLVNTAPLPVGGRVRVRAAAAERVDRLTARRSTHFHAISGAVADDARRRLGVGAARITVVPRGRDRERLGRPSAERRVAARRRLGIDERAAVVVHVGREEWQKGHVHLVAAAAPVVDHRADVVFVMAGRRGASSPAVDAAVASSPARHRILRLGHVDEVGDVLAAADLFAFPSLREGLGGSLLEAMAMEVPIVASDLPAVREAVEMDGRPVARLVAPGAEDALARAISDLLADEAERARMAQGGGALFEQRYTLERVAGRMVDLIESVASVGRE